MIQYYDLASMAEASYVDFSSVDFSSVDFSSVDLSLPTKIADALKTKKLNGEFSAKQAADFISKWNVTAHTPIADNGYSSTVFKTRVLPELQCGASSCVSPRVH